MKGEKEDGDEAREKERERMKKRVQKREREKNPIELLHFPFPGDNGNKVASIK